MNEEQHVIDGEVIDSPVEGTPILGTAPLAKVGSDAATQVNADEMLEMGIIVPTVDPKKIRAAFAVKQQTYAAILDPETDFLYTISYAENGQKKEFRTTSYAEAKKVADLYGVPYKAHPKKSGIAKLAAALGIEGKRIKVAGLPDDPRASWSHVEYEATHQRTGQSAIGVGWADQDEKGGKQPRHYVIATADTRAYNRAVLRLAGFGVVSAEELGGIVEADETTYTVADRQIAPSGQARKPAKDRPAISDDKVVAAARAWAAAIADRREGDRFASLPTQEKNGGWRETRARARRGDVDAATRMGKQGIHWEGVAQDASGYEEWIVEQSPVLFTDILRPQQQQPEPAATTTSAQPAPAETKTEQPAPTAGAPTVPSRLRESDTIISKQAETLSTKLFEAFGIVGKESTKEKEEARAWLRASAGVDRSTLVRNDQYEPLCAMLDEMITKKKGAS